MESFQGYAYIEPSLVNNASIFGFAFSVIVLNGTGYQPLDFSRVNVIIRQTIASAQGGSWIYFSTAAGFNVECGDLIRANVIDTCITTNSRMFCPLTPVVFMNETINRVVSYRPRGGSSTEMRTDVRILLNATVTATQPGIII